MAQMTKDFALNLLKRVKSGQHINTTVWEEEQLLHGWLYWHQEKYEPAMKKIVEMGNSGMDAPRLGAAQTGDGSLTS